MQLDAARAGVAKGGAAAAAQWFGQDLFDDANVDVSSEEEEEQQQEQQQAKQQKQKRQPPQADTAADEQQQQQRASKRQQTAAGAAVVAANGVSNGVNAGVGCGSGSGSDGDSGGSDDADSDAELDSDEEEFNALDDAGKAEVLALAKKMLRRKDKDSIVEAAYNRWGWVLVGARGVGRRKGGRGRGRELQGDCPCF